MSKNTQTHFKRKQTNQKIMPTILILLLFFIGVCVGIEVKTHTCENNNDNAFGDLFKCITLFAQACIGAKKSYLFFSCCGN